MNFSEFHGLSHSQRKKRIIQLGEALVTPERKKALKTLEEIADSPHSTYRDKMHLSITLVHFSRYSSLQRPLRRILRKIIDASIPTLAGSLRDPVRRRFAAKLLVEHPAGSSSMLSRMLGDSDPALRAVLTRVLSHERMAAFSAYEVFRSLKHSRKREHALEILSRPSMRLHVKQVLQQFSATALAKLVRRRLPRLE